MRRTAGSGSSFTPQTTHSSPRAIRTADDCELFVTVLGDAVDRYGWLCHTDCLMGNHYHLLVETPRANLSLGMRQINGLYARRFNLRHRRCGRVFQARFRSILVEAESSFLSVSRYIVPNPVRAGICTDPRRLALEQLPRLRRNREAPAVFLHRVPARPLRLHASSGASRLPALRRRGPGRVARRTGSRRTPRQRRLPALKVRTRPAPTGDPTSPDRATATATHRDLPLPQGAGGRCLPRTRLHAPRNRRTPRLPLLNRQPQTPPRRADTFATQDLTPRLPNRQPRTPPAKSRHCCNARPDTRPHRGSSAATTQP
jgi:REP element-mobilizing transposase RayT